MMTPEEIEGVRAAYEKAQEAVVLLAQAERDVFGGRIKFPPLTGALRPAMTARAGLREWLEELEAKGNQND